jgi:hypothetical protein
MPSSPSLREARRLGNCITDYGIIGKKGGYLSSWVSSLKIATNTVGPSSCSAGIRRRTYAPDSVLRVG